MEHSGSEDDVANAFANYCKDKIFVGVIQPPRDFGRLQSLYLESKAAGRSYVVDHVLATYLMMFNGRNGNPKLSDDNIYFYLPEKDKGMLYEDGVPDYLRDQDYSLWERELLNHPKRISLEEIGKNQGDFVVYTPQNRFLTMAARIKPKKKSGWFASVPRGWTDQMKFEERRFVEV